MDYCRDRHPIQEALPQKLNPHCDFQPNAARQQETGRSGAPGLFFLCQKVGKRHGNSGRETGGEADGNAQKSCLHLNSGKQLFSQKIPHNCCIGKHQPLL